MVAACRPTVDELLKDSDVELSTFDEDPFDDGPPPVASWMMDASEEQALFFTAWGMFDLEQSGVWTSYNVAVAQRGDGPDSFDIRFVADMDSIETGVGQLDDHIRTPDFLDVPGHPKATFSSSAVTEKDGSYAVSGDMTLRGHTAPIEWTTSIEVGEMLHTTGTIEFSRWEFGLYADDVEEPGGDGAQDRVVVEYDVWLSKL